MSSGKRKRDCRAFCPAHGHGMRRLGGKVPRAQERAPEALGIGGKIVRDPPGGCAGPALLPTGTGRACVLA